MFRLDEARDHYLKAQGRLLSEETIKLYRNSLGCLVDYLGEDRPLEEIETADIMAWRTVLFDTKAYERGHPFVKSQGHVLSKYTIRRIMVDARTFFNWFVRIGVLDVSPAMRVELPKTPDQEPRAISAQDFEKLVDVAGQYRGNKWNYKEAYEARNVAILYFLASTGCRIGGMCGAREQDLEIGVDGGSCRVPEKGRAGGKRRRVYFSDLAGVALLEWLDYRPETDHDFLFTGIEGQAIGRPLTPTAVRQMLTRLAKRAGVKGRFNPHSFRHAAAREWLQNGANLATVSQMLGHSDTAVTTKFYARWTNEELQEVHRKVRWA